MDLSWIKVLEVPALMLSAVFVYLQQRTIERLTDQLKDMNGSLSKLSAIVDLICSKVVKR